VHHDGFLKYELDAGKATSVKLPQVDSSAMRPSLILYPMLSRSEFRLPALEASRAGFQIVLQLATRKSDNGNAKTTC
jgi:hypothetical protein